jgi:short-subunit dehydrogenase
MTSQPRRVALVTGASAGIGRAFAEQLALQSHDLVLTARRQDRLETLASELRSRHDARVEVIAADLSDPAAPEALLAEVAARGLHVDVLVNNAGYGLGEGYRSTTWQQNAAFLQVMITSVAHLTHLCVLGMVERGYGRIVHVASLAGLIHGAPGSTLYAASKAFMVRFAESLALELEGTGVSVTAVCPGYTVSEFHDVAGTRDRVSKVPGLAWMDAETVARQGVAAALRGQTVYVNGALNRAIEAAMRFMPKAAARGIMRGQAKRYRKY